MRKSVKKEAAQLTEAYCKDADEMIFRNIRALPEYQRADTVFCYVGTKTEIKMCIRDRAMLIWSVCKGRKRCETY